MKCAVLLGYVHSRSGERRATTEDPTSVKVCMYDSLVIGGREGTAHAWWLRDIRGKPVVR
jgi:hypothetical protein